MNIVPIKGATHFTINLDPTVWIFDKRKIDLDLYIQSGTMNVVQEREISGSYGIPFAPFLQNAEVLPEAKRVICHQTTGESKTIDLLDAQHAILAFAKNGKPLKEDGPVHLYFGEDKFKKEPITHISAFEVDK